MEKMAYAIGERGDAKFYVKRRKDFYKKFQQAFFDEKRGVYVDGIGIDHASLHANLYPLAFGLVPEKQKDQIVKYIKTKGMACGVYSSNYLLEGLFEAGAADYAMKLLTSKSDRSWYNMLRVGATMTTEAWDNKYKSNNGWSHAWSSSPSHILPRKIMGIEPVSPGFERVRIKPQLADLSWVKVKLPTIRGSVEAEIFKKDMKIEMSAHIPANMLADVYVPIKDVDHDFTLFVDGIQVKNVKISNGYAIVHALPSGEHYFEVNF